MEGRDVDGDLEGRMQVGLDELEAGDELAESVVKQVRFCNIVSCLL